MNINIILGIVKKYFDAQADIATAYVFGSVAKGTQRPHSDIDIAILFVDGILSLERFERKLQIENQLESILGIKTDVADLESADAFFVHQVLLKKLIIVDKDIHRRVDFEVNMRRTYFDMQPLYELYSKQALIRLEKMYQNGRF